jgi:hypothetical protein
MADIPKSYAMTQSPRLNSKRSSSHWLEEPDSGAPVYACAHNFDAAFKRHTHRLETVRPADSLSLHAAAIERWGHGIEVQQIVLTFPAHLKPHQSQRDQRTLDMTGLLSSKNETQPVVQLDSHFCPLVTQL